MGDTERTVTDEVDEHRLVYRENGVVAELVYRVNGTRLILVHTEVPEALGGQGIGGRLVHAAVDRAAGSGETLQPWCSFARKWLGDHPDVAARVAIDWSDPPPA